ncbi:hypothetical protein [Aquitalea sp. LB_tupeE]|uniref:hypothetical protein n=1 Tax=Aquitalea sp. LB_tupeE TaxID=2748078 RepID=UPI0015C07A2D|nr:hypothetical protein [Aquitalea sp. LB_tupeE]NWK79491.1 hypothetical protein [Aquitalea sp. LB_tupeE]
MRCVCVFSNLKNGSLAGRFLLPAANAAVAAAGVLAGQQLLVSVARPVKVNHQQVSASYFNGIF